MPLNFTLFSNNNNHKHPKKDEYLLNCTSSNMNITCPANYPPTTFDSTSNQTCPEYFRWIHEDMKTWKNQGITKEMVERLKKTAHFRLVIVNGTAYVKQYTKAYQTRDDFTLWGILQLIKLYPGRLPDLDLMFQCHDKPSIKRKYYQGWRAVFGHPQPPPQFHYCGDDSTFDIVFPDWSFWGWPEVNVKPWVPLEKDLKEGNAMKNWTSRKSIGSRNQEKGLRTQICQSNHYWPINDKRLCKSIKFAVEWGNNNGDKAQEIGKAGSRFIFEQIKMENVYDYMFHVLNEYGKLLQYTPTVPEGATALCSERFACSPMGLQTTYKIETMVDGPSKRGPCDLPPPYDSLTVQYLRDQNEKIKEQVKTWEQPNTWFNW
ncbi:O-glucosyltransferase rumi [Bienertia sinuspersici]